MLPPSAQAPSTTVPSAMPDDADVEPDEEWKARLRKEIEENLASMVKEAKDSRDNQLREAPVSAEDRERLTTEYKTAMNNIRQLAAEQFQIELDRERQERRWASGMSMNPQWTEALKQEQQTIMDRIKQGGTGSTQPGSAPESPVEELPRPRPSVGRTMPVIPNYDPPPLPPQIAAQKQEKANRAERERERVTRPVVPVPPQPLAARRSSDTPSRDRDEHPHSFRRAPAHGTVHERPPLPDTWVASETTEEPEDLLKRPRRPTLERSNTLDKWDPASPSSAIRTPDRERSQRSISERHAAHSPPNSIPAIWKPSISPEEDAAASKPFALGRRGSTASMRSIGSATGIRPPATEPIPERPDDDAIPEGERERGQKKESDKPWVSPIERKESGLHRSDSRLYVAPSEREERAGPSPMRTSPIPYPAPSSTARPIVSKPSFNEEHRYDRPSKGPSHLIDRDQPSPLSAGPRSATYDRERDFPLLSAGARPIAQMLSHGGDRDYSSSPPVNRHVGPKSSFASDEPLDCHDSVPQRRRSPLPDSGGSRPRDIVPKHSFPSDDYQESHRDREPTRTRSREYLHNNDSFDERERLDRYRNPDAESEHRQNRARQGSYSRGWDDSERDRHYDDYPARNYHGGPSTTKPITVPRHHAPPPLADEVSSWKDWAGVPEGRRGYDPNFRPPQLPPIPGAPPHSADSLLRRRESYRSAPHSARYHDDPGPRRYRNRPYDDDELEEDYGEEPGLPRDDSVGHRPMRPPSVSRPKDRKTQEEEEEETLRRLEAERQRILDEREKRKKQEQEQESLRLEDKDDDDETDETDEEEGEEKKKTEEDETKKREEEAERKRVEAARLKLEEDRKKVEEEKRKVEEEKKKVEEEKKKAEQLKAEEAKRLKEKKKEERRQAEEKRKAEAALKQLEVERQKKQEEADLLEEKIREKRAEAERLEKEAHEKEATAKRLQEEAQARANKVNQMNTLAKKKEAEMRQRELALRQREGDLARREERFDEEMRAQEEERERENEEKERNRLENEEKERVRAENEEKERLQAEAAKAREAERKERQRQAEQEREAKFRWEQAQAQADDARRREAQKAQDEANRVARERQAEEDRIRFEQQEEFRRREEEIRRRTEERKRQDSIGADGIWPGTSPSASTSRSPPQRNGSTRTPAGDRTSNGSSSAWSNSSSNWSASTKATTASNASTSSTAGPNRATPVPGNKPRAGSVDSGGTYPLGTPPHTAPPMTEADWQRRQAEQARKQQEQFRKEQERLEAERQAKAAGRPLTRDEVIWIFDNHEKLWSNLPSSDAGWSDFPWPMIKKPTEPEEITLPAVSAYILSPHYPEKDKSKTDKDRIKDHIKRWHPDRFDTKLLTKVREEDKEKVKEGAGVVVRCLNELLSKSNGSLFD